MSMFIAHGARCRDRWRPAAWSRAQAAVAATYTADPASSRLEFTGVQAGAEFKGVFHKFSAAVDFAPGRARRLRTSM